MFLTALFEMLITSLIEEIFEFSFFAKTLRLLGASNVEMCSAFLYFIHLVQRRLQYTQCGADVGEKKIVFSTLALSVESHEE